MMARVLHGALLAVVVSACARTGEPAAASAVPLPDLSKAVPSVQRQIRDRAAALDAMIAGGTVSGDLAEAYGSLGKVLMAAQFVEAAAASFAGAERVRPDDYRWPYYLAHLARRRGDSTEALARFQRARDLQPADVATRVWLGETYLLLGQAAAAEVEFQKARDLQPASVSAAFGLGRAALALKDYRSAVRHLEEVLTRDPTAVSAHYPLSQAYAALGDAKTAERHLRLRADHQVLPADPLIVEIETVLDSPHSYETLGIRAIEQENWPGAAEYFRKGLALAPDSAALHHRLGTALGMQGDRDLARREFEIASGLSADYHLAPYSLGLLLQEDGRHAEAVARFEAALEARPSFTPGHLRLASSLRRLGRVAEAVDAYRRALAQDPSSTEARIGLAMALVAAGHHRDARDLLAAAPDAVVFKHGLARLLATSRDDGVRDGVRAMILIQELMAEGRSLDLGETMAMAVAEVGDFLQAASIQRELLAAARQAGLGAMQTRLAANLSRYEKREPVRTPWTLDEIP